MDKELVKAVLEWWKEHQFDVETCDAGDGYSEDYNVYDDEPKFVKIAKRIVNG